MMQVGVRRPGPGLTGVGGRRRSEPPFPDQTFDRVLIGYGLRNFADLGACLTEIHRTLRPGGRLVALDFGHPPQGLIRAGYFGYLNASTRLVGWALHRDAESYVYIPESLRRFPGQRGVLAEMEEAGFVGCGFEEPLFGTMAINYGDRAED